MPPSPLPEYGRDSVAHQRVAAVPQIVNVSWPSAKNLQPETASGNLDMRRLSPFYQIRERSVKTLCVSLSPVLQVLSALPLFRNSLTQAIRCSAWLVRIRVLCPLPRQEPMCFGVHSKTWTACGVEQPTR